MKSDDSQKKLKQNIQRKMDILDKSRKEKTTLLAQTVYLGTLGFIFILPVIIGAYLGVWLDNKNFGFSISWTISLIIVGVFIGAVNVYLFIKE